MNITLKTLTPLWTGGVDGTVNRLHETGIIGSLRWWYEALVRGLGGYACDPTGENRCEYNAQKSDPPEKQLCPACYLFGATGWGRKFRLRVLDEQKNVIQNKIDADQTVILHFVPLRFISDEEWCLLRLTVRLIAEYGALGGKTVFKPSDETDRQKKLHHKDFGLLQWEDGNDCEKSSDALQSYVTQSQWRSGSHIYRDRNGKKHDYSWASLTNFWCVKNRYLTRKDFKHSSFNLVVGRKQDKSEKERRGRRIVRWSDLLQNSSDAASHWLAGSQQESKKVFSFKEHERTFGFVKPDLVDFDEMKTRLNQVWTDFNPAKEFLTGEQILKNLTSTGEEVLNEL